MILWLAWLVPLFASGHQYTLPGRGPCRVAVHDLNGVVFYDGFATSRGRLRLPDCGDKDAVAPLALIHSGFLGNLDYYVAYADNLASWGFAVMQYDVECPRVLHIGPCLQPVSVLEEASTLPYVVEWVRNETSEGSVPGRVDTHHIAVVGHSRGGDVAFHQRISFSGVDAVALIDPVMQHPPRGLHHPHKMLVIADGIRGPCTPEDAGPSRFLDGSREGSVEVVVSQSGHAQFWHAPPWLEWLYNIVCGRGRNSGQQTIELASTLTTAWLLAEMRSIAPQRSIEDALSSYDRWLVREQDDRVVKVINKDSHLAVHSPGSAVSRLPAVSKAVAQLRL